MELFTPEFGLIFWMFVVFVLLVFLLGKFAWPYIVKSLDERAALIDNGVTYATEAKNKLDNAKAEGEKYIKDAQLRQTEMLQEVAHKRTELVEQAKAEAQEEAHKVIEQAKSEIERVRRESATQLHDQIGDYAITVAEKILRTQLTDRNAQYSLIDKIIDDIETEK
jgi:F-type H+-transporting ATPase subunit b